MKADKNLAHNLTLVTSGAEELTIEVADALFGSGCDDATPSSRNGVISVEFDREAPSLAEAIRTAIRDVEGAGVGLRVVRIEAGELVTASEIARKVGKTRQAIQYYASGKRGPGGFPTPVTARSARVAVYRWEDVASWMRAANLLPDSEAPDEAATLDFFNAALGLRRAAPAVADAPKILESLGVSGVLKARRPAAGSTSKRPG